MNNETIAQTALRVGMINGLLVGIDPDVLRNLIKNASGEFRYVREAKVVLELYLKIWGKPKKPKKP